MFGARKNDDGTYTLTLDNGARERRNAISGSVETLPIAYDVEYTPTRYGSDNATTQASLWYAQREREYRLVKSLYTMDQRVAYRQLCVFAKSDNAHKRLCAVVMYTPRGNVWFDVTTSCKVTPRGTLHYRKVSESIARELLGVDSEMRVYLQSFKEVLHEQAHRMQDKRRYHAAKKSAPKDRRVGEYILPANYGQIIAERKEVEQVLEDAYLYRKWA